MHNVAMFPVFAGPTYHDVAANTEPLRRQFFYEFVNGNAGFLKLQVVFPVIAAAMIVYLVKLVNVFPLRWRSSPSGSKGRYCRDEQYSHNRGKFHDLSFVSDTTKEV